MFYLRLGECCVWSKGDHYRTLQLFPLADEQKMALMS